MLLRLIEELRAQGKVTPIVLSRAGSRLAAATRAISAEAAIEKLKGHGVAAFTDPLALVKAVAQALR